MSYLYELYEDTRHIFLDMLENRFLLEKKLDMTKILIWESPEESILAFYLKEAYFFQFYRHQKESSSSASRDLLASSRQEGLRTQAAAPPLSCPPMTDEKDPSCDPPAFYDCDPITPTHLFLNREEIRIRFGIGHELCHILFSSIETALYCGYSADDDSFSASSVRRKIRGEEAYGDALEEMLCDYFSVELLCRAYQGIHTRQELLSCVYSGQTGQERRAIYDLTETIVSAFGEAHPEKTFDELVYDETTVWPRCYLLYHVIVGSLSIVIHDYEETMGKGSWKRLNQLLDLFYFDPTQEKVKYKILLELKRAEDFD
ncbi:MAG TPA: hypothetical protein IAB48_00630 [Candidatus Fimimorpha excrementavium]|nr:hypothetical protein [Candidatus Fimimorpha excrementavium]